MTLEEDFRRLKIIIFLIFLIFFLSFFLNLLSSFFRVDTIIINQNKLLYQECCQYSEKNFTIYLPLINEVKTINIHERSDSYLRYICPPYHPYKMIFSDLNGNEILELNKPYRLLLLISFNYSLFIYLFIYL